MGENGSLLDRVIIEKIVLVILFNLNVFVSLAFTSLHRPCTQHDCYKIFSHTSNANIFSSAITSKYNSFTYVYSRFCHSAKRFRFHHVGNSITNPRYEANDLQSCTKHLEFLLDLLHSFDILREPTNCLRFRFGCFIDSTHCPISC